MGMLAKRSDNSFLLAGGTVGGICLCEKNVLRESLTILYDASHILCSEFELLPSGRQYRVPKWRTVRASRSFVSNAVLIVNNYLKHKHKGIL